MRAKVPFNPSPGFAAVYRLHTTKINIVSETQLTFVDSYVLGRNHGRAHNFSLLTSPELTLANHDSPMAPEAHKSGC